MLHDMFSYSPFSGACYIPVYRPLYCVHQTQCGSGKPIVWPYHVSCQRDKVSFDLLLMSASTSAGSLPGIQLMYISISRR